MASKELKRMSRKELLELLIVQSDEIEALKKQLEHAKKIIEERKIRIDEAGTLAEAAMVLNDVFRKADAAAEEYLENIRRMEREKEEELAAIRKRSQE